MIRETCPKSCRLKRPVTTTLGPKRISSLPAAAQLHRHGGGARREGRRVHDHELHKTRLHILNFAVHSCVPAAADRQPDDPGSWSASSPATAGTAITLEIRETNLMAQLFYKQAGFRAVKVVRSFYDDTGEDAYILQYRYHAPVAVEEHADARWGWISRSQVLQSIVRGRACSPGFVS